MKKRRENVQVRTVEQLQRWSFYRIEIKMEKKTRKREGIEEGAQIRREFLFIVSIFINRNKKKKWKKEEQLEDIQIRSKKL